MNFKDMSAPELLERRAAIATDIDKPDADLDALEAEARAINEELETRKAGEAKRNEIRDAVANGAGETIEEIKEERDNKPMGIEEIRNSKEYVDAFANYIKTGKDEEVRALLSTNATVSGAYVPVPEIVEGRIRTAWQKLGIMDLVRKSYAKGNVKVGFELSADGALIHNEGTNANNEEALTLGVVELKAESIKKWITISDEAIDMSSEEFLFYIYDEITYRIAKKAQEMILAKITAASTSASSTAVSVAVIDDGAPSVGIVAECMGLLSDEAVSPAIVMNKATWSQFKAAQYAAGYAVDPFEGLPVYFDNTIPAYSSTATTGTWLIVGDFGVGAQANFPAGDDISIKVDDLSLAEKDLVKFVGREYVGLGLVGDKAFCRVTMHT